MKNKELEKKIDDYQNEYLDIMIGLSTDRYDVFTNNGFQYHWERSKKLQQYIITFTLMDREIRLKNAKDLLENAFTPKLKKMLKGSMQNDTDKEKSNG